MRVPGSSKVIAIAFAGLLIHGMVVAIFICKG